MSRKILLVDDEKEMTDLLGTLLSLNGFQVETANDPQTALDRLSGSQYDIVVLDLMMGDIDGLAVLRDLREKPEYSRIPIFVLSAKTLNDDERKSLLLHRAHFISKPFVPRQFVQKVNDVIKSEIV